MRNRGAKDGCCDHIIAGGIAGRSGADLSPFLFYSIILFFLFYFYFEKYFPYYCFYCFYHSGIIYFVLFGGLIVPFL